MNALPLAGRRILVTRAAHQAGKLSEGLRALGAEPVEVPVLEIIPPESYDALDRGLRALSDYDWLILTSANAVRALAGRAASLGLTLTPGSHLKIAAIGEATAESARHPGLPVTLVPDSYVAESLIAKLVAPVSRPAVQAPSMPSAATLCGQRILIARASIARDVIPHALRAAGAAVDVVDAYRNVMPESAPELLRHALEKGIDAAAFTSSSSVTHLAEAARQAGISFPFPGVAAISIGPITSKTLRDLGWEPVAEASPSDVPGLIDVFIQVLSGE